MQILKRFAGTFRWAQTLKLGGVYTLESHILTPIDYYISNSNLQFTYIQLFSSKTKFFKVYLYNNNIFGWFRTKIWNICIESGVQFFYFYCLFNAIISILLDPFNFWILHTMFFLLFAFENLKSTYVSQWGLKNGNCYKPITIAVHCSPESNLVKLRPPEELTTQLAGP